MGIVGWITTVVYIIAESTRKRDGGILGQMWPELDASWYPNSRTVMDIFERLMDIPWLPEFMIRKKSSDK